MKEKLEKWGQITISELLGNCDLTPDFRARAAKIFI